MSNLREAAQQALDALNGVLDTYGEPLDKLSIAGGTFEALVCRDAITALRAALAQPEPSPGWCKHCRLYTIDEPLQAAQPEPAAPPTLTDERIDYIAELIIKGMPDGVQGFCKTWGWRQFARALLADCSGYVAAAPTPQEQT